MLVIDHQSLTMEWFTKCNELPIKQGAYPDSTSYCLINEGSVTELNTRLEDPVTPERFRPNFVVKGSIAYEEDSWGWIKIGDVMFKTVRPCTRCIFTTVDPETGKKNPKAEPLKTLKRFAMNPAACAWESSGMIVLIIIKIVICPPIFFLGF